MGKDTIDIHENHAMAVHHCKAFEEELYKLQERYGVWIENDDSCSENRICCNYRTETGEIKRYSI